MVLKEEDGMMLLQLRDELLYHERRVAEVKRAIQAKCHALGVTGFNLVLAPVEAEAAAPTEPQTPAPKDEPHDA